MNKCDITIGKKMTINTGNYSSIQPSVSITMKDVYTENLKEVYKDTENVASALLIKEINSLHLLQKGVKSVGVNELIENVDIKQMESDLKESIKKLSGMPEF